MSWLIVIQFCLALRQRSVFEKLFHCSECEHSTTATAIPINTFCMRTPLNFHAVFFSLLCEPLMIKWKHTHVLRTHTHTSTHTRIHTRTHPNNNNNSCKALLFYDNICTVRIYSQKAFGVFQPSHELIN